jgi:hypothetical protein
MQPRLFGSSYSFGGTFGQPEAVVQAVNYLFFHSAVVSLM